MRPFAVVVADVADPLASEASDALARRRFDVRSVDAQQLALLRVTVHEQHAEIEARRLDAVVFLPSPLTRFGVDFDAADRDFCDAEVRAVWLAIINMDSVATVTRWSPEEGTSLGEWAIWRRRLIEADVPQAPSGAAAKSSPAPTLSRCGAPRQSSQSIALDWRRSRSIISTACWRAPRVRKS